MSKRLKALIARELEEDFKGLDKCVIVGLTGIPAVEADRLRADLDSRDMRLQVVKNSLASIALRKTDMAGLERFLDGPSALLTGGSDVVELVKAATDVSRKEEGFWVRGAFGEGRLLSPEEVEQLSKIPGREELYARFAGALVSKLSGFAGVVSAVQRNFVYALSALKSQRSEEE